MTGQVQRARFNAERAPALAVDVGIPQRWQGNGSARFAYFEDDARFAVVAGEQEGSRVDLALAYGLTYRGERHLILVLPRGYAFPTLQRAAWLKPDARPEVFVHAAGGLEATAVPSRDRSVAAVVERLDGMSPTEELATASTPTHLGELSAALEDLVEWAGAHPQLDPAHRRGERSWHCVGQRVLSLRRTRQGSVIRAGIHGSGAATTPVEITLSSGEALSRTQLGRLQEAVTGGITARLSGAFQKPDEHWLQAVIRRQPSLAGIEQPALRELPAWRPAVADRAWGRGYIDLAGLDAHGDMRIVETKLADNRDELLILQGVDYYVWAQAYKDALRQRLAAPKRSDLRLHYLIGATPAGAAGVSQFAPAQAAALDFPWRVHVVRDWFHPPAAPGPASAVLLPPGQVPGG